MTNFYFPQIDYRICNRCVMDTSVPKIRFDKNGNCNFCKVHDNLNRKFDLKTKAPKELAALVADAKKKGRNRKFDCVVGISGGRDSSYCLHYVVTVLGLRPVAVHFNDGFGNPVAGENMIKICKKLGVELRTITSDWRESKDLKITGLKASTPDMLEQGTDIGIATALYGIAAKEGVKYIILGQSFRTEGISPLFWNYLDGDYLRSVQKQLGSINLRKWKPEDPGFNFGVKELLYYSFVRGIKTISLMYYLNYVRSETDDLLKKNYDWVYTGAHYYDDLYQSLMTKLLREKFNCDRRKTNYSSLIRSGQMTRDEALERLRDIYIIEDPKVIDLCIKRLGLTLEQYEEYVKLPPKTFMDYPNNYKYIRLFRPFIKLFSNLNILPSTAYDKYFNCGA